MWFPFSSFLIKSVSCWVSILCLPPHPDTLPSPPFAISCHSVFYLRHCLVAFLCFAFLHERRSGYLDAFLTSWQHRIFFLSFTLLFVSLCFAASQNSYLSIHFATNLPSYIQKPSRLSISPSTASDNTWRPWASGIKLNWAITREIYAWRGIGCCTLLRLGAMTDAYRWRRVLAWGIKLLLIRWLPPSHAGTQKFMEQCETEVKSRWNLILTW